MRFLARNVHLKGEARLLTEIDNDNVNLVH